MLCKKRRGIHICNGMKCQEASRVASKCYGIKCQEASRVASKVLGVSKGPGPWPKDSWWNEEVQKGVKNQEASGDHRKVSKSKEREAFEEYKRARWGAKQVANEVR